MDSKNFALIGVAGYIAPRHMKAIRDTGNKLVATIDPHESVGILDSFFPEARFFTEIERFDRYLEKVRRGPENNRVHYISICSPNYLHDAHIRLALRIQADAVCEKPLVINPWNLDALEELEAEYNQHVYTVLQLRLHPHMVSLKKTMEAETHRERRDVCLTYITRRGAWYGVSWKGNEGKSGGIAMNIGIHFFDLMGWLFGAVEKSEVHLHEPERMAGVVEHEWARVKWFLSVREDDLPAACRKDNQWAYRSLTIDGQELDFSTGFTELHTRVYEDILAGRGFGIRDARTSIQLVHDIRHQEVVVPRKNRHPKLT